MINYRIFLFQLVLSALFSTAFLPYTSAGQIRALPQMMKPAKPASQSEQIAKSYIQRNLKHYKKSKSNLTGKPAATDRYDPVQINVKVPGDFRSIQDAIDAAQDGDIIQVGPGVYSETLKIVNKSLTLKGSGRDTTIINGRNQNQLPTVFIDTGNVDISGFTIRNGNWGVDINDSTSSSVSDCVIRENKVVGIGCKNSKVELNNNLITDTVPLKGAFGRGTQAISSNIVFNNNTISNNAEMGIITFNTQGSINNCIVGNNKSTGLNMLDGSNIDVTDSVFDQNGLTGIFMFESTGTVTKSSLTFNKFRGIGFESSESFKLVENIIKGSFEIGVFVGSSTGSVLRNEIINNKSNGINIQHSISVKVEDNRIASNEGTGSFLLESGASIIKNSIINNKSRGLGIQDGTNIEITDNVLEGNASTGNFKGGIAVFGVNGLLIKDNTIRGNIQGLIMQQCLSVEVTDNTIEDNFDLGVLVVSDDNVVFSGNKITGTTNLNGFGDGVEIQESVVVLKENEISDNDLDGARIFSNSIIEFIENSVTESGKNGLFCDSSSLITGCCNIIDNNATNLKGCSGVLSECPCPTGDVEGDRIVIEPFSVLLTRIEADTQLTAILESQSGAGVNITNKAVWSSSNGNVAIVDSNGLITSVTDGESELCAEFNTIKGCVMITVDSVHAGINKWTISPRNGTSGLIHGITVDPVNSNTIYAGTNSGEIFVSLDKGETWQNISRGLRGDTIKTIAIDPFNSNVLYAGASESLYKSFNGGETWEFIPEDFPVDSLVINPLNNHIIYAGTRGSGVLKSSDAGITWKSVNKGLLFKNVRNDALVINSVNPDTLYVAVENNAGEGKGVYKTINGGRSWNATNSGLFNLVRGIAIDPVDPEILYAGTLFNGIFKTVNGGKLWSKLTHSPHEQSITIEVDNINNNIIYNGTFGSGVFMSRDAGNSWKRINDQLTSRVIRDFKIDPVAPSTIYAGTTDGVFRFTHAFEDIAASPDIDGTSIDLQYIFNTGTGLEPLGFNIYRSSTIGGDFEKITDSLLTPGSSDFKDIDFLEGSTHVYKMTVVDEQGESFKSFTASAKPLLASNPDFSFEAVEEEKDVVQGEIAIYPLKISSQDNFDKEVFLTTINSHEGINIEFIPRSGVPPFSSQLIITTGSSTLSGNYKIDFTADDKNKTLNETVNLHVISQDSNESVITQTINATDISVGKEIEITGKIIPARVGANVTIDFQSPDGKLHVKTTIIDKKGAFSAINKMDKSGTWQIKSTLTAGNGFTGTGSDVLELFVPHAVTTISISTDVTVNTIEGDTLLLSGKVLPDPGSGNILIEIINIDGSINFNSVLPLSGEGSFTHRFKVGGGERGNMRIKALFKGNNNYSGSERKITVPIQEPSGMAIIVAGGGNVPANPGWVAVNSLCNYAYTVIKNQGISDVNSTNNKLNRIFYLHPDPNNDADGDGIADTDADANAINLQNAIENLVFDLIDFKEKETISKTPLTIYMAGTGTVDLFQINENETVSASQLDTWLDNLHTKMQNELNSEVFDRLHVNVIIESPQSGSFIDDLREDDESTGKGRAVITSTDFCDDSSGELCKTGKINLEAEGITSFSRQFFFGIKVGKSITTAWSEANIMIRSLFDNQKPQLDTNGNGSANEDEDEIRGSLVFINRNRLPENKNEELTSNVVKTKSIEIPDPAAFVLDHRPVITGHQRDIALTGTETVLWVTAIDPDNNLSNVQALLFPPKSNEPELLELEFSEINNRYEVVTDKFKLFGLYNVLFVAKDKFNNNSIAAKTLVSSQNIIPALLKGQVLDTRTDTPLKGVGVRLQGFGEPIPTDEKGNFLFQIPFGVYTVIAGKEGFLEKILKDVRVETATVVQNIRLSPLTDTSSATGSISGVITETDNKPINNAKVSIKGTETNKTVKTAPDGSYQFLNLKERTYKIKASKRGFKTFEQAVELKQDEQLEFNIMLN